MSEAMAGVAKGLGREGAEQSKARSKAGRLALFLRASLPDFVLCIIVSVGLVFTVSFGFESAASLRVNVLLEAGISAAVLVALFIGSWSRKALVVSAIATVAVSAGIIMGVSSMMPADVPLFANGTVNDVEENYVVFALVAIIVTVAVFLLSRRTAGLFFLLFGSAVACGAVQFLYREWSSSNAGILAFLVVLAGIVMMFVYQVYRSSILQAMRAKKPAFFQVTGFALIIAVVCVGLAYLLFVLVIAHLGLTTPVIKPFRESYQRPEIEYTGMYNRQQIEDPNLTTRNLGEEVEETNDALSGGDAIAENISDQLQEALIGASQAMQSFNSGEWAEQFQTLGYQITDVGSLIVLLLVALAIAAIIWLQRMRRLWRLKRWRKLAPTEQVEAMYAFFVNRLGRLAIRRPPNLTLLEWSFANRGKLAPFSRNDERVDFLKLTLMYQRVVYAQELAELDQVRSFECFYDAFFKNARAYVGKARWLWKFWRI